MDEHIKEERRLFDVLRQIAEQSQKLETTERYVGDDITEQVLEEMREKNRQHLKTAEKEPYFARLDFQEDLSPEIERLYIGKVGIADSSGEPLIIDWRAPISSLFYSFTGGDEPAYYESPEGLIEGTVHLKRNIVIRQQQLQRIVDAYVKGKADLSGVDEFLLHRLSERTSSRLQDIVSTIQAEQNAIIRAPKNNALIIQGVAGSGKTTIALHRLAYLIYEHQDRLRSERMIIFAPSTLFLDYIADVLPELGVGNIQQTTFNDWAIHQLEEPVTLDQQTAFKRSWLETTSTREAIDSLRYKGSRQFKEQLKKALDAYEAQAIPERPLILGDVLTLSIATLQSWFNTDYKSYPLLKRKERMMNRIKNEIDNALKSYAPKERQVQKKKVTQTLRTYTKKLLPLSPVAFYKQFISAHPQLAQKQKEQTLKHLEQSSVQADDLPSLLMIQHTFYGIDKGQKFHHVVVDEAQDFSPFQIDLLKQLTLNQSFTILGDLSQGIHDYKGIDQWEAFSDLFDPTRVKLFKLEKSYRSTTEIIAFANTVLAKAYQPVCMAEPVFRSGEAVTVISCSSTEQLKHIQQKLIYLTEKGYHSVGILTRTQLEAEELQRQLKSIGVDGAMLTGEEDNYDGGLSILPMYLSKGLEFEAVIITNANVENFPTDAFHSKLLYVGCTRALHNLSVLYQGQPSLLLP
ncbi:DNA helicase [Pullulanibacillus camelliae]|uniref:DNA 3'-5' helicase n=1 Tax=Pullulanibacillus camelliae TaxID=1707096 RepID=A0A8J2VLZ1_9BACL|nr:UvrD-helicase domain-containing protein [Pullulanibacillus camelliae]GGE32267.1 DNA helicase [Pullulanibacillus camelliae]